MYGRTENTTLRLVYFITCSIYETAAHPRFSETNYDQFSVEQLPNPKKIGKK